MKTPETRAKELFNMVHGPGDGGNAFAFNGLNPAVKCGWKKVGKMVLRLERKWTAARKKGEGE